MTHLTHGDGDLHWEDGSHRGTPGSADGRVLEAYERRIRAHLAAHETAKAEAEAEAEICAGSGRVWGVGGGTPICTVCHLGPAGMGVKRPRRREGRWGGVVPVHAARV